MSDVFQKWNPFDLSILHNGVQVLGLARSLEVGHKLCPERGSIKVTTYYIQ